MDLPNLYLNPLRTLTHLSRTSLFFKRERERDHRTGPHPIRSSSAVLFVLFGAFLDQPCKRAGTHLVRSRMFESTLPPTNMEVDHPLFGRFHGLSAHAIHVPMIVGGGVVFEVRTSTQVYLFIVKSRILETYLPSEQAQMLHGAVQKPKFTQVTLYHSELRLPNRYHTAILGSFRAACSSTAPRRACRWRR